MLGNVRKLLRPSFSRFALVNVFTLTYLDRLFLHTSRMANSNHTDLSAVYITCPNREEAKTLASKLVQNKMAACVNIIPNIYSVYEWEGKIHEDPEVLMFNCEEKLFFYFNKMIKTKSIRVDDISAFIRENHSYDVAEVISLKIENGNEPYLKWLQDTVANK